MKQANIAVVGHGYWGKNHVRNFHALGALRMVCDPAPDRRELIHSQYPDVTTASNIAQVLCNEDIEGVVLATPAETHYSLARQCLMAGKDVLVEKPLALNVRDGKRLIDLAREQGRIIMVGHILEYHPALLKLKALVDEGRLGRLQYIYSNRLNLGKVRREENILWSFAPHDVAVLLRLLDEMPLTVAAVGGTYLQERISDVTVSNFTFPSGVRAHIHVSWLHPFKEQKLVVVGDGAMAVFDDQAKQLLLYDHAIDWVDEIPVPRRADAIEVPYSNDEPLRSECSDFLEAIAERKQPRADGESGLRVLRILSRCQESLEQGGRVLQLTMDETRFFSHASATIDGGAVIGSGTRIWHYTHVMGSAEIGNDCILGQNVYVGSGCRVGHRVKIQNNVSVYNGVTLEDDVFCGPSMVFTNVKTPRAFVERKNEFATTRVGRGATLGANSTVVCGNNIGAYAMVAAGAVVTTDVPAHALVMGVPAKVVGWVCQCGERHNVGAEIPDKPLTCLRCGAETFINPPADAP